MPVKTIDQTLLEWLGDENGDARPMRLAAGEAVFRQGDHVFAVFLVTSGRVRLVRNLEDGSTVALHTAQAGESFAEASISAKFYHCDAVAEVPTTIFSFPIRPIRHRLTADPAAAVSLAILLAGQVRDLRARLELRNIRSATARLRAWLQMNAIGAPPSVPILQPWTEVATEIGLTQETLYRALAELSRIGAIRREAKQTVLLSAPPFQREP